MVISVRPYKGNNSAKRSEYLEKLQVARQIESYINDQMKNLPNGKAPRTFNYGEISSDLGINQDIIAQILRENGGGSNGITIGAVPDN
jgi:hypothetical protein